MRVFGPEESLGAGTAAAGEAVVRFAGIVTVGGIELGRGGEGLGGRGGGVVLMLVSGAP